MIDKLNEMLEKAETSFTKLETSSVDLVQVWSDTMTQSELTILEQFADKFSKLRLLILRTTAPIIAGHRSAQHPSTPSTNPSTPRPVRINEALKPDKLNSDSDLSEYRSWKQNFDLFYSSNSMDKLPVIEQHGYVRSCIDLKLQQIMSTRIDMDDPIAIYGPEGYLSQLKGIFLQNTPLLTRRYGFSRCDQQVGEKFSDWYLRLQLLGREAELNKLTEDDSYVLRFIIGTCDTKLREEFLRQDNPDRQKLLQIANAWESASVAETSLAVPTSSIAAVSSYKKNALKK
jgi:hypothetical protein